LPLNVFNGETGWIGKGVINDTFFSNLAPRQTITLLYLNKKNNTCIIDTSIIGNYAPPTIKLGQTFTICKTANDTLLSAWPTNGKWTGNGINTNGNFSPKMANLGKNYLSYYGTDSNGCSNTDTLTISVKDYKPALSVTDSVKACVNGNLVEMEALPKGGKWTAPGFTSNNNKISVNPKNFGAGRYSFIYNYVDENKCANADTALAIIYDLPKPAFTVDSVVKQGDTLKITNLSTVVYTAKTIYTWIISAPTNKTANGFEPSIIMDSLGLHSITLIATDNKTTCTDTLFVANSVEVVLKTAIQLGKIAGLSVYPNPFSQELNFSNSTGQTLHYQLYTQEGKLVYNKISQDKTINLNLNHLAKGVYTLKVSGNGLLETQQIIKK